MADAANIGLAFYEWAKSNGFLVNDDFDSPGSRKPLSAVFPPKPETEIPDGSDQLLGRLMVTAVFHDEPSKTVTICTKGAIPATRARGLPPLIEGVSVHWIGSAQLQSNPPPAPPQPPTTKRSYRHKDRIACGSSIHPASIHGAGSLGCLVQDGAGTLFGLSNNHVTGGCNHMEDGMPILSPAPFDASPDRSHPVPETLGRHTRSIPILSGDPRIIPAQLHDAAIFEVVNPDRVTSMHGDGAYDTPTQIMMPIAGVRVMKVGRTTGLTRGQVIGVLSAPVPIPYNADRFKALVYIGGALAIMGDGGQPFSQAGDSGSLVVTEDGQHAVGLIAAGTSNLSFCMPLEQTLKTLGVNLVSGHGV
ncbi:hypothetical protein ABID82_003997 [Methylobacterium sp. PvP062]|uniref:Nal1 C-terminal domain-containing protein n=1 Tax=Methylobacterium radiotolerans TaxID=31998 RepID=A0ABV2NGA3_9HYPH|nr:MULTISPECIES: hypothetical protein [unclassified Methylobacterium]MBP2497792.1 hypothetical protein [Methylobacterium sp. PvP105]MBP2502337.1 hypothetical protein [Methylobacterium sp. PvP109]MCX7335101.1 hypothetical protein [Hyphomicrobiales bacterium]